MCRQAAEEAARIAAEQEAEESARLASEPVPESEVVEENASELPAE